MIRVLAPAKINLGLEILGKRNDRYHEIRTILCAVSRFDVIEVDPSRLGGFHVDDPALVEDNLIERAMRLIQDRYPEMAAPEIRMRKQIPSAAGLGGASSDAAAVLLAVQRLNPAMLGGGALQTLAGKIGSDVPFFLRTGLALASGRGETLQQLPIQRVDIVIVNPPISITGKTATMYGLLRPSDWSDGSIVMDIAAKLERRLPMASAAPLPNAFTRPLYALHPTLADLSHEISRLSGLPVQVSGAGPAHFVICQDAEHRQWIRNRLRTSLRPRGVRVLSGRTVRSVLLSEG